MLARGLTAVIVSSVVVASASISPALAGSSLQLIDGQGIVHLTNVPADPRYRSSIGAPGPNRVGRAGPGRPAAQYASDIEEIARRYAMSPALIEAVVRVESGFDPNAVSPKGASGLMQLMPQTAARLGVPDRFDPRANISGGVRHLRYLLDRFGGDVVMALAAYNAGEGAVDTHRGVPPYPETTRYVTRVLQRAGPTHSRETVQVIYRYPGPDDALTYSNLPPGPPR